MPKGVATTNPTAEEKNARELFQINHKIFKTLAVFSTNMTFCLRFLFPIFPCLFFISFDVASAKFASRLNGEKTLVIIVILILLHNLFRHV